MSLWGPLADRYETSRPRKLLALDGGGIRGVLTLEVLAAIEQQLAAAQGRGADFRLCDYFDYIAGTSTGAIIAAGLCRGMSVAELLEFYIDAGPAMFDKQVLFRRWKAFYSADPLKGKLQAVFGATTDLTPGQLRSLLLVVTRNLSTDSPWPISSNPCAKYNQQSRPDCNLRIPLWQLVRASTAAPVYFPPETLQWDPANDDRTFVFVDGGVTPYNNPAFLLYRLATLTEYCLGWPTGERHLTLVSVGTGAWPQPAPHAPGSGQGLMDNVRGLPGALMYGAQVDQDVNCRMVGRCVFGGPVDREIGDLIPRDTRGQRLPFDIDLGKAFLYARYNADLSSAGLARLGLTDVDAERVRELDAVDAIDDLRRVGRAAAREVSVQDFDPTLGS